MLETSSPTNWFIKPNLNPKQHQQKQPTLSSPNLLLTPAVDDSAFLVKLGQVTTKVGWTWIIHEQQCPIGYVHLHPHLQHESLEYIAFAYIQPEKRGNGHATEALKSIFKFMFTSNKPLATRISILIPDNQVEASERLCEKLGMKEWIGRCCQQIQEPACDFARGLVCSRVWSIPRSSYLELWYEDDLDL